MKLLPQNELYRYQVIATLTPWLVYSVVCYFTGSVVTSALGTLIIVLFTAFVIPIFAFLAPISAIPAIAAAAFAVFATAVFAVITATSTLFVVFAVIVTLFAAIAVVFAVITIPGGIKMSRDKVVASTITQVAATLLLFYISTHFLRYYCIVQ